jgi:hypothetical protein
MNKKLAEAEEELYSLKLKKVQPLELYNIEQKVLNAKHNSEFALLALDDVRERIQETKKSLKENEEKLTILESELSA